MTLVSHFLYLCFSVFVCQKKICAVSKMSHDKWENLILAVLFPLHMRCHVMQKKRVQKIPSLVPHARLHMHILQQSSGITGTLPNLYSSESSKLISLLSSSLPSNDILFSLLLLFPAAGRLSSCFFLLS